MFPTLRGPLVKDGRGRCDYGNQRKEGKYGREGKETKKNKGDHDFLVSIIDDLSMTHDLCR